MIDRVEKFVAEHGGPWVCPKRGRAFILRSGACLTSDGTCLPPPADPRHRLKARLFYHKTLLERAQSEWAKLEAALRFNTSAVPWQYPDTTGDWFSKWLPPIGSPGPVILDSLQTLVQEQQAQIDLLEKLHGPEPSFVSP